MKTKRAKRRQPQVATSAVVCDGADKCPDCNYSGYQGPIFNLRRCPVCKGTGRIASRSHTDKILPTCATGGSTEETKS
jgi:DnaJ-class molecular chaperone